MKALPGVIGSAGLAVSLLTASVALGAPPIYLCIGANAGQGVKSGGATGTCPKPTEKVKYTKVALPSEEAEQQKLLAILPYLKYVASGVGSRPTIQVSGANVQILSGSGSTSGPINGAGNLVIGYDEAPRAQTGSHNLILGGDQAFSSFGAILGGTGNTASGNDSFVVGNGNTASGEWASVSGGGENTASGEGASVSGGGQNTAAARQDSVSGGGQNRAEGRFERASVSGGAGNIASGENASVGGGKENTAGGLWASVSGGERNLATSESQLGYFPAPSWVGGGSGNVAKGSDSSVSGGVENEARTPYTSVSGGSHNVAGGPSGSNECCEAGQGAPAASVTGGYKNTARAAYTAILGGKEKLVTSEFAHFP